MLNKIISVIIECIFPQTHLQKYLLSCSYIEFIYKLTPRTQKQERLFSPFYYKDKLVKDCIIELKERNNTQVANLFGKHLSQYIKREINIIQKTHLDSKFFLVPVPQHASKTKEKGFIHTHTLVEKIYTHIPKNIPVFVFPCIIKQNRTKRLHDLHSRKARFRTISQTMKAYITKRDSQEYFFCIDDVHTTGATFKEMRRSLLDSGALSEHIYFISIAH